MNSNYNFYYSKNYSITYSLFRIIRQIKNCGKYIIDVFLILFFLIALAALISRFLLLYMLVSFNNYMKLQLIWMFTGYYLFADTDPTVSRWTSSFRSTLLHLNSSIYTLSFSLISSPYLQYFPDLGISFVSTFITMTTAKWV